MMNFAAIRSLSGVHRGIRTIQKQTLHFNQLRNMSQSKLPVTLLGSMAFGGRADAHMSAQMVQVFLERGHNELDTAFMYNDGQAETIIGDMQLPTTGTVLPQQCALCSDHSRYECTVGYMYIT